MSSSPTTAPACRIEIAPTAAGFVVRVAGRGTARESRVVRDAATRALQSTPPAEVAISLLDCEYLDSTFLGCLLQMHRIAAAAAGAQFYVAIPTDRRAKLFGSMRLDRVVRCVEAPPAACGPSLEMRAPPVEGHAEESARHVMECHRQLAALDTPMRAIFARIADEIEHELKK